MAHRNSADRKSDAPVDYYLTYWYLNIRRVIELVGVDSVTPDIRRITALGKIDDGLRTNVMISALKKGLTNWLHMENPPTHPLYRQYRGRFTQEPSFNISCRRLSND